MRWIEEPVTGLIFVCRDDLFEDINDKLDTINRHWELNLETGNYELFPEERLGPAQDQARGLTHGAA